MIQRVSKDKSNLQVNLLKEVGYILLLVTFFVGTLLGAIHLKNVDDTSFEEYTESLTQSIAKINTKEFIIHSQKIFYDGIKTLLLFWIVGMSVVGTPILVLYIGYKGYSLSYTISALIKMMGMKAGNQFAFQYLFFKNSVLIFLMIFLANFSIKVFRNFFQDKMNIKENSLKYTVVTGFSIAIWLLANFIEKVIFTTF